LPTSISVMRKGSLSAKHSENIMADDLAVVEVYHPPKDGLPYLAVAIVPDGKVHGVTADTAAEAQKIVDDILAELAKATTEQQK